MLVVVEDFLVVKERKSFFHSSSLVLIPTDDLEAIKRKKVPLSSDTVLSPVLV